MAKVLMFSNYFESKDQHWVFAATSSTSHQYDLVSPGRWRANPRLIRKHENMIDYLKRLVCSVKLFFQWKNYDVLFVESCMTGLMMAAVSFLGKGHRKLVIGNFNIPRHRKGVLVLLSRILFQRVDHLFVHSTYDIQISSQLYHIPAERFTYWPYVRSHPHEGDPGPVYLFEDRRPFVFSFGSNARDYGTFLKAIEGTDLSGIVVARDWNLEGLSIPKNVRVFCNVPPDQCDKLANKCLFTVFTSNGSEPSWGQISIVTSFMVGKPTICTDSIGIKGYVLDGVNGLLVKMQDPTDLREKMLRLANNRTLYDQLCIGARTWAAQYANPIALQQKVEDLMTAFFPSQ